MPGRLFPYDVRDMEPWVGPSRSCSCSPRWRASIIAEKVRLCQWLGKAYLLMVTRTKRGWKAVVRQDSGGRSAQRTGFQTAEAAKWWATHEFYRMCQGKRAR